MKKVLIILLSIMLVAGGAFGALSFFSHNGENESLLNMADENEQAVKDTVNAWLRNLKQQNIDQAYSYVLEGADDSLKVLERREEFEENIQSSLHVPAQQEMARDYFAYTIACAFRDYKTSGITVGDTSAKAKVTLIAADSAAAEEIDPDALRDAIESYLEENGETIYNPETDESYEEAVQNVMVWQRYNMLKDSLSKAPNMNITLTIQLEKQPDGNWKISSIKRTA